MGIKRDKILVKRFASYYKPHIRLFTIDMACAFIIAGIDLAFPMLSKIGLSEYLPKSNFRGFFIIIIVMLTMFLARGVFQYILDYWGHILGVRMEYDMRKELFNHLQKLSFKFYDKTRTGHIMSRMVNDLNEMTELAHHGPEDIFLSAIMLLGAFGAMLYMNWKLTLAIYIFIPFLIIFTIKQRGKMSAGFKSVKVRMADVNADLESSISGIRVSKSFTNELYEINKFNKNNNKFKVSKNDAYKYMAIFIMGIMSVTNILYVVVLGFGGYLIYTNELTIPELLAFTLYVSAFLQPIKRIASFTQLFESGMTGFERFIEILDTEPLIQDSETAIDMPTTKGNVIFEQVTFSYNNHETVLKDISLEINAGKNLALVGPSGGGKSTLCHLIPRFYEVDGGRITLDGHDIRDIKVSDLRRHIGLVSQDVFLFAGSIRDNIMYGRIDATEEDMIEAAKNAEIHDFINGLSEQYDTQVGERGLRLSGGQKQRISIARVFLKNPEILILDEATSALDNETEMKIQKALAKLSEGRTTLVIAHRLSTIKNADEIVVITEEGIKERGTHDALLEVNGVYANLYHAQFKGYIPDDAEFIDIEVSEMY